MALVVEQVEPTPVVVAVVVAVVETLAVPALLS
jgi:hypothetical protein